MVIFVSGRVVCGLLSYAMLRRQRLKQLFSARKTQSPLVSLKYQKSELLAPEPAWYNAMPFKDFAR